MPAADEVIRELLPLFRRFAVAPCGIALGGSHAKGTADAYSDVDVYLFADRVIPAAARAALVRARLGDASAPVSWGADDPWIEGGTDFEWNGVRVEVWLRSASSVDAAIQAALRGELRRDHVFWTVMGFFHHTVLADVHTMRVVDDSEGTLGRWKDAVATYPEPLRGAILRRFLGEASFWPRSPHYLSAVERGDAIYAAGIVQQVAHALIQAVFALNRTWFPGEKKVADALRRLPLAPVDFAERIEALLCTSGDVARLGEQQAALAGLVDEVRRLG
jgi:hypothetical protein